MVALLHLGLQEYPNTERQITVTILAIRTDGFGSTDKHLSAAEDDVQRFSFTLRAHGRKEDELLLETLPLKRRRAPYFNEEVFTYCFASSDWIIRNCVFLSRWLFHIT